MDRHLTFADSEFSLSDPGMEDALYEITSMHQFAGLSLDKPIPDQSTILKFRHLLEQHGLARRIFADAGYRGEEKRKELKDVDADWYSARSLSRSLRVRDPQDQAPSGSSTKFGLLTINGGWHS